MTRFGSGQTGQDRPDVCELASSLARVARPLTYRYARCRCLTEMSQRQTSRAIPGSPPTHKVACCALLSSLPETQIGYFLSW